MAGRGGKRATLADEILARCSPAVARVAGVLRVQLRGMIDGVVEEADAPRGRIRFRRRGPFAFLQPMSDHIRLGFDHGDALPDLSGLLAGEGRVRYLELRTAAQIASREVKLLLSAALFDDDTHGFRRRRRRR